MERYEAERNLSALQSDLLQRSRVYVQTEYLWDSINDKRGHGWDKNPWVWVISFRRA
jgi:hypothetical protein